MNSIACSRVEVKNPEGVPIILILLTDGSIFYQWNRFRDDQKLGSASQISYSRSICRFIDFLFCRGDRYLAKNIRADLFQGFADTLLIGSLEDGDDPSGLFWQPAKSLQLVTRMYKEVMIFVDALAESQGIASIAPSRGSTLPEQMVFWRAWNHQNSTSLLKHLRDKARAVEKSQWVHAGGIRQRTSRIEAPVKSFPDDDYFGHLIRAFERSPQQRWTTLRDQMILLLLRSGCRISDVLHMWITDVFPNPENSVDAEVRLYHPWDGSVMFCDPLTGRDKYMNRAEFLRIKYDRLPLTALPKNERVGWKELLLNESDGMYARVFFRPDGSAVTFMRLFREYIRIRPLVTKHPYLWVTSHLNPMMPKDYEVVHKSAVRRIGLIPRKQLGTTCQGHRHGFAKWLSASGADKKIVQIALHHKSIKSQDVYTQATLREVQRALEVAGTSRNAAAALDNLAAFP